MPNTIYRVHARARIAKYNRLLRIEEEPGETALYGSHLWREA